MQSRVMATVAVLLATASAAVAQSPLFARTVKEDCKMRVTYIERPPLAVNHLPGHVVPLLPPVDPNKEPPPVKPPVVDAGKVPPDAAAAKAVAPEELTLTVTDWRAGRAFTDDANRRWCLVRGTPSVEKPARVRGWLLRTEGGKAFFLTDGGRLYCQIL